MKFINFNSIKDSQNALSALEPPMSHFCSVFDLLVEWHVVVIKQNILMQTN
jgi:hypothetical protein